MLRISIWRVLIRLIFVLLLLCITCVGVWWFFSHTLFVDDSSPTLEASNPARGDFGVSVSSAILVTFRKSMKPGTISSSTFWLSDSDDRVLPAIVNYQSGTHN